MAALKKLSAQELSKARRAGFKRKKPKMPKKSASLTVMENYVRRWNEYVDAAKAKIKAKAQKEADKKKKESLYNQIKSSR